MVGQMEWVDERNAVRSRLNYLTWMSNTCSLNLCLDQLRETSRKVTGVLRPQSTKREEMAPLAQPSEFRVLGPNLQWELDGQATEKLAIPLVIADASLTGGITAGLASLSMQMGCHSLNLCGTFLGAAVTGYLQPAALYYEGVFPPSSGNQEPGICFRGPKFQGHHSRASSGGSRENSIFSPFPASGCCLFFGLWPHYSIFDHMAYILLCVKSSAACLRTPVITLGPAQFFQHNPSSQDA